MSKLKLGSVHTKRRRRLCLRLSRVLHCVNGDSKRENMSRPIPCICITLNKMLKQMFTFDASTDADVTCEQEIMLWRSDCHLDDGGVGRKRILVCT